MSQRLAGWQAVLLGAVVTASVGLAGYGLTKVAARQGVWADTVPVSVGFPEAHDVAPGTPVRVRGVDAGQVEAVDYPADDGPGATVTLRLRLDARFAARLYADATAEIQSTGLLGSKVIAVRPGTPAAGPLGAGELRGVPPVDLTAAAAKLTAAAGEAEHLLRELREGTGTLAKLVRDDDLYHDLKGLSADARGFLKRADAAAGVVEGEAGRIKGLVADGRDTLRSVKQGTDALAKLPIVRGYVEDSAALLVRPAHRRERMAYNTADLFEPGSAVMSDAGRAHLGAVVEWLGGVKDSRPEVVVAAFCDPADPRQTPASATELTRKQAEVVVEFLKDRGVHKLGWTTRRKMTPIGLGQGPSPVVETEPLPASNLQVLLFTPQ